MFPIGLTWADFRIKFEILEVVETNYVFITWVDRAGPFHFLRAYDIVIFEKVINGVAEPIRPITQDQVIRELFQAEVLWIEYERSECKFCF